MNSSLDNVNELLRLGYGDTYRLNDIKQRLENGKVLYASDSNYLQKLGYRYRGEIQKVVEHKKPEPTVVDESKVLPPKKDPNENTPPKLEINKKQTKNIFCTNCGNQFLDSSKFCTNCGKSSDDISETNIQQPAGKIWYLLPLTLYWIGGIIAWAKIKNRNPKRARNCLIVGFLCSVLPLIPAGIFLVGAMGMGSGSSEINDALSIFPEQIQNIKREQILTCENNMGYLQSFELGEMIKERCINGILGK